MKIRIPHIESVLHASQREVLRTLARFSVLEIGRRWGKTTFGQQLVIEAVLAGKSVAWFAPNYKFLADPTREFERALAPLLVSYDKVEKRMTFKTRGHIDFWTMEDTNSGRGRSYDLVVVDEAGFAPKLLESWRAAILPTLTDRSGSALFLGTPKGTGDFHQLYLQAECDSSGLWRSFRLGSNSNPYLDPAEIEIARSMLPSEVFAQEYEGIPAEDGGNPFGLSAIRSCIGTMSNLEPECWGVDLAKSVDWTVAIGIDANFRVCRAERWQGSWALTREKLVRLIGSKPAQIDSTGVGDPIVEDIKRVCPKAEGFRFSSTSKQQLMEGLQIAIQTGELSFPDGWIRAELESFGFRYSGRTVSYEATSGHDDAVCALALAVHARRRKRPLLLKVL